MSLDGRLRRLAIAYVAAAAVFAGLDAVWLSATSAALYRPALAPLLADRPRLAAAVAFYVVYLAGLVGFAVRPALRSGRWTEAARLGAGFGFVAYATYDLTNLATLRLWPVGITLLDLAWGVVVSACGATAGCLAVRLARPGAIERTPS